MILTYTVTEKDWDRTVYSIMRRELLVSAALTRRLKVAKAITVSGVPVFTDYKLTPGEEVMLDIAAVEPPCDNIPEHGEIEILFENEGLIAVNKPTGIIVHPSRSKNTGTLANYVAGYLEAQGDGGACHAVNRLDRDTSGVVLFAKNSHMKSLASAALADGTAIKEYLALVYGNMPESGIIDVPIKRLEERNMLRVPSQDGQKAVTHYETINTTQVGEEYVSLVKMRLETGRTHQIRVHCLHIGHPVLGDRLYSTEESRSLSEKLNVTTQALHAQKLIFKNPLTIHNIEIVAQTNPKTFPCILHQDMLPYISASPVPS